MCVFLPPSLVPLVKISDSNRTIYFERPKIKNRECPDIFIQVRRSSRPRKKRIPFEDLTVEKQTCLESRSQGTPQETRSKSLDTSQGPLSQLAGQDSRSQSQDSRPQIKAHSIGQTPTVQAPSGIYVFTPLDTPSPVQLVNKPTGLAVVCAKVRC